MSVNVQVEYGDDRRSFPYMTVTDKGSVWYITQETACLIYSVVSENHPFSTLFKNNTAAYEQMASLPMFRGKITFSN